ncbi:MAG: TonB-dependent receptor [Rhizomicrobium sp.]
MRNRHSAALLAGSAICALLSTTDSRAADAAESSTTVQVETVVVTAQRRAERSVDTPISVYVASGDQLHDRGATNFQDLQNYVPGVHMDQNGLAFQPTIRGVGSAISGPGDSANVATYVDGFYRPSMNSNNMQFDDVASIQVLKGPQGTLFGRNATGGAFLVTTNQPSFDFGATARLGYGSDNTLNASGFVTGGLSDTVAASLSAYGSRSDGSVTNIVTGKEQARYTNWGVRSKLLYQPDGDLTFTLAYEHTQIDDPTFIAFNAYHGWTAGVFDPTAVVTQKRGETSLDGLPVTKVQNDGLYLKGVYDMGWATLTSYTSGAHERVFNQLDMDSSSSPLELVNWHITEDTITQEFDLASEGEGPFKWVAGLYYYNDSDVYTDFDVAVGGGAPFVAFANAGQRANSVAAFVDGTYNVWDNLYLTLGARYSYDRIAENFILGAVPPSQSYSHDFNSFTPRAVLRYQLTPDSNVYLSYSQGYKSGVYNVFGAATTPVKPETISAFELGYKVTSSDWDFETSAYYYNYKNLQINTYVAFTSQLVNAANSQIYGLDANLTGRLTDDLTLNASAAYTHARYTNFPDDPSYTWDPASGVVIGTIVGDGLAMQRVPEFQMNIGLDYHHPLFGGVMNLQGNYGYQTKVYFDPADVTQQPAYGVLNLRASWTDADGRWQYSVFGNNVTDEAYITQVLPVAFAFNQSWASPAVFGAEVRLRY